MVNINIITEEIDQSWSIERIATERAPHGWKDLFRTGLPELKAVSEIIAREEANHEIIYPLKRDLFAAFHYTPLHQVKVVIIGQDPYPQKHKYRNIPRAVGLSFSVREDDEIPSSLKTIYTELQNTVAGFHTPNHGDLRSWTRQGVLLLNAALTVRAEEPESHQSVWVGFIKQVIKEINKVNESCIFVLWGAKAQNNVGRFLTNESCILRAGHPSGYSRHLFLGCDHFNKINEMLIAQGREAIVWQIPFRSIVRSLPGQKTFGVVPVVTGVPPKKEGAVPLAAPVPKNDMTSPPSAKKEVVIPAPSAPPVPEEVEKGETLESVTTPEAEKNVIPTPPVSEPLPPQQVQTALPEEEINFDIEHEEENKDSVSPSPVSVVSPPVQVASPPISSPPKTVQPLPQPVTSIPKSAPSRTPLSRLSKASPKMQLPKMQPRPLQTAKPAGASNIPLPPAPGAIGPAIPNINFRRN